MSEVSQNSKQAYRNLLEGCSLTVQLATESKPSNTVVLSTLLSILPLYLGKAIIFKKTLSVFFLAYIQSSSPWNTEKQREKREKDVRWFIPQRAMGCSSYEPQVTSELRLWVQKLSPLSTHLLPLRCSSRKQDWKQSSQDSNWHSETGGGYCQWQSNPLQHNAHQSL